jgi:uncharacterized Zn-finger protein
MEWSKVTNLCPLCKSRFDKLSFVKKGKTEEVAIPDRVQVVAPQPIVLDAMEEPESDNDELDDEKDEDWKNASTDSCLDDDVSFDAKPKEKIKASKTLDFHKQIEDLEALVTKGRLHACEVVTCGKVFTRKGDLARHALVHTNIRAFECSTCSAKFKLKGELKRHQATHTTTNEHVCKWENCGKTFSLKGNLDRHVKTVHLKERTAVCPVEGCGKSFTQSGDLTRHMAIHEDKRDFCCEECGTSFRQKAHLQAHILTHQKPL